MKECFLIKTINHCLSTTAKKIIDVLLASGIETYLVGGFVRDCLLKKISNDYDIEVVNVSFEKLLKVLEGYDLKTNLKFKSVKIDNVEISLARIENKIGMGYDDYNLSFVDVSLEQAVVRRDFSINSIIYDCKNDIIIDYYNGIDDLNNKIIRAIDYDNFTSDSSRILRMLDFQSRFNFKIDKTTYDLAKQKSNDINELECWLTNKYFENIICNDYFDVEVFCDVLSNYFNLKYVNGISVLKKLDNKDKKEYLILFCSLFFLFNDTLDFDDYKMVLVKKEKNRKIIQLIIEDIKNNEDISSEKVIKKYNNQCYLLKKVKKYF